MRNWKTYIISLLNRTDRRSKIVSNYSDHKDHIPNRGWIKFNIKK